MRRPRRFALGVGALQIVYLAITCVVWTFFRYQSRITGYHHGGIAGDIVVIFVISIAWIVNPILCAYTANQLLIGKRITIAVGVFCVYFVTAPVFKYVSYLAWIHVSGYYAYLLIPTHESMNIATLAGNETVNVIGVLAVMIEFVVAFFLIYSISRARSKSGGTRPLT